MALISSESMTLMVNGTLQSEFFTMFWPMRFTYSVTVGSVMNLVLFSISEAKLLPILISVSVEYQLPIPRPPISRLPTALTSSILPGLILPIWLPGAITFSGSTAAAATSPFTGSEPGAGSFCEASCLFLSFLFLSFFLALVSCGAGGTSPATGVVPGAGCALVSSDGAVLCVEAGGVDEGAGSDWVGDCAQPGGPHASENAATADVTVFLPVKLVVITAPPGKPRPCCRFARLVRR